MYYIHKYSIQIPLNNFQLRKEEKKTNNNKCARILIVIANVIFNVEENHNSNFHQQALTLQFHTNSRKKKFDKENEKVISDSITMHIAYNQKDWIIRR